MKKLKLLFLVAIFATQLNGIELRQIIEPYHQSFMARHPYVIAMVKSLAFGGLCTATTACFQNLFSKAKKISPLLLAGIGTITTCAAYLYNRHTHKPDFVDMILTDPIKGLNASLSANKELDLDPIDEENNIDDYINKHREIIAENETKWPIFLLGECTKDNNGPCTLSRSQNPHARKSFENKACSLLAEKISDTMQQKPINWTSFGCGRAYQDFVIMLKTLAQYPQVSLNIHLIDHQNISYVNAVDFIKATREIKSDKKFSFGPDLPKYTEHYMKNYAPSYVDKMADYQRQKHIMYEIVAIETQYKQFISTLQKIFPKAQLSLFIHDQTDSYLNYIQENKLPHADIVTSADVQDITSFLCFPESNYKKLCIKTLQEKPLSNNVWLKQEKPLSNNVWLKIDDDKNEAYLIAISLSKKQNSIEEKIKIDDKKQSIYLTTDMP